MVDVLKVPSFSFASLPGSKPRAASFFAPPSSSLSKPPSSPSAFHAKFPSQPAIKFADEEQSTLSSDEVFGGLERSPEYSGSSSGAPKSADLHSEENKVDASEPPQNPPIPDFSASRSSWRTTMFNESDDAPAEDPECANPPSSKWKEATSNESSGWEEECPKLMEAAEIGPAQESEGYSLYQYNIKLLQSEYDHEANLAMCTERIVEIQKWLDQFQDVLKAKYMASVDMLFNEVFAQLDTACQEHLAKLQESGVVNEQNKACRAILEKSKSMFSSFQT